MKFNILNLKKKEIVLPLGGKNKINTMSHHVDTNKSNKKKYRKISRCSQMYM